MTDVRAMQALAILDELERLPPGSHVALYRVRARGAEGRWSVAVRVGPAPTVRDAAITSAGETATDALGQVTTVLALERNM